MPKGRKIIKTWLVPEAKRESGYAWIKKLIKENGDQAFIICPFIEESENMQTVKAATVESERLQKDVYPDLRLGLLHGKLKAKEKETILSDFREGKYDILVATPVVEVGIDIPNATVILIEAAERFGLAQLHQLRGRVGRGTKQSYCLLYTSATSPKTITRLKAMESSQIGAELAELDLKLRGPGELYGTQQSGVRELKVASFSDFPLIEKARKAAKLTLPKLAEYPILLSHVEKITIQNVSPD
jgi:ATP-dependent DNA helicase RecG